MRVSVRVRVRVHVRVRVRVREHACARVCLCECVCVCVCHTTHALSNKCRFRRIANSRPIKIRINDVHMVFQRTRWHNFGWRNVCDRPSTQRSWKNQQISTLQAFEKCACGLPRINKGNPCRGIVCIIGCTCAAVRSCVRVRVCTCVRAQARTLLNSVLVIE